jgi:pimeloyl-ACP methyl ester carboxylesterase
MAKGKDILCPDLFTFIMNKEANYKNLYAAFVDYCNSISEPLNLCGLSLGGILALNYAIDFNEKVNSLVLIGTQHKIPKMIFNIQTMIFKILPNSVFNNTGLQKKETIKLSDSMKNLDFSNDLANIPCPALVICGSKDTMNIKSAKYLSKKIQNAEIKIIENAGHAINTENPKRLALELETFFKYKEEE